MQFLDIKEGEPCSFAQSEVPLSVAVALSGSTQLSIEWPSPATAFRYIVRCDGWIGHIPVGQSTVVRVAPKIPVRNIFRMLETAYHLQSFRLFDGRTHIETLQDVFDRIASILAQRVIFRVRKGIYRGYRTESGELSYVRGRIDFAAAMRNTQKGSPEIPCEFEEHTPDLDDNQILLWTLRQASRSGIGREKVRREIAHAYRALAGSITLDRKTAAECVGRIYHRLNLDYRPMHGLCRFILEHTGPGVMAGDPEFIPFQLNMPALFETFVAEWLRDHSPEGAVARPHHQVRLDANDELTIRIDVLLRERTTGRALAVLDTKYKASDQAAASDIYQVAFYAHEIAATKAFLVYPSLHSQPIKIKHRGVTIERLVFDIEADPDEAGQSFFQQLVERIGPIAMEASRQ